MANALQTLRPVEALHNYQCRAIRHVLDRPAAMLWLDVGLGKSCVALSTILDRLDALIAFGTLVVAPKRVCRMVWRQEAQAWAHTRGLTFSVIQGTPRERHYAMRKPANIHLINYDNLPWLVDELIAVWLSRGEYPPFQTIIYDEVSKLKDSTGVRSTAIQRVTPYFPYRIGLTGTPASNGYTDLFGQYLVIDGGARLGTSYTKYLDTYFTKQGFRYALRPGAADEIKALISDITLEMSQEEYLPMLAKPIINDVWVELPAAVRVQYDQLEKDMFFQIDSGEEIEVFNAAALINKLLQAANGQPYIVPNSGEWVALHDEKLDALQDIVDESGGQPILVAYEFQADRDRIMTKFPAARFLGGDMTEREEAALQEDWDAGKIPMLIGHPGCVHPRTEVLTEYRGWIRIIDIEQSDRVFDGVEFVNHDGCQYSGYREVIDVFGLVMTPDHKLLVGGQWVEAQDVKDRRDCWEKALCNLQVAGGGASEVHQVQRSVGDAPTECQKTQPEKPSALPALHQRPVPPTDRYQNLAHLARNEKSDKGQSRPKLWWARYRHVSRMVGQLQTVLCRYVARLQGQLDHRTERCEWSVLQEKLCLDTGIQPASQQTHNQKAGVPWAANTSCGVVQDDGYWAVQAEPGTNRRGGRRERQKLDLRNRAECKERTHVYDLVNCGPRHRFVIRNDKGEVVISHNSMGHGLNLQYGGHIGVWFGLNWSLDLYIQFIGRLARQGQTHVPIFHRIMAKDTADEIQRLRLLEKDFEQTDLKRTINSYRHQRGS